MDVVKVETEPLYGAQDIFSRVALQSFQLREAQNQDGALKDVGGRRWKDVERRWEERALRRILVSQVGQAPGEDRPERL